MTTLKAQYRYCEPLQPGSQVAPQPASWQYKKDTCSALTVRVSGTFSGYCRSFAAQDVTLHTLGSLAVPPSSAIGGAVRGIGSDSCGICAQIGES